MSRIEELIAELCPEGVEFRPIGELGELVRGNGMPKSDFVEAGIGCIHYGQIYTYYRTWATETKSFVSAEKARKLAKVDPGDLVITNTSENLVDVCKGIAWLGDEQVVTGGHATVLKHRQDSKYLSYYLQTPRFFAEKKRYATGTKVVDVSARNLAKIQIPLPPLEIQREIVKVLDAFREQETELEAELRAELEARRRQHKDYRDTLLALSEKNVRWVAMGEVGKFVRGRRFTKADYVNTGIECIHYGDIYTQYGTVTETAVSHLRADMRSTLRYAGPGDLIIAGVGETVEDVGKAVAWLGHGEVAIHDDCFAFRHSLNPRFVSYYFQTSAFHAEKNKFVARAKVKRLSAESLAKLTIPVPSPEEQARIVAILDKFDALINEISLSLPAEIAARRRQYAYYRDRLLTFKEVV